MFERMGYTWFKKGKSPENRERIYFKKKNKDWFMIKEQNRSINADELLSQVEKLAPDTPDTDWAYKDRRYHWG